ncbi:hypothetical protein [Rhodoferax sp. UBA5149]|nr:hypothetical protein [Rhodoferax sp. UBA5149]
MAAQWRALPRRRFAATATLQVAGDTATRSWLIERPLLLPL